MLQQFSAVGIFTLFALVFVGIMLVTSRLVRPKKPGDVKSSTYECGLETEGPTWVQFKVSYFLYALVFLLFDVETIFLYPWALKFQALGWFAFGEMFIFIGILVVGLWYAWKEGALQWK